ncbi:conserved protein of unknown function [Tenacibaculum sp. 190130A14a]|uniref:DUF4296 domain-containing protein n=1 Tax=Tenacibaculum polynesiense TaxID=3137857 RepID=A0ABM9PEK7_9FLAO
MKKGGYFLLTLVIVLSSCTSNTVYEKPDNLIPKDSMVALLTDMYVASSAKNRKNKFLKREKNYVKLVYEKYKIDSTRFDESNTYYTSKIEDYTDMLKEVKKRIDSLFDTYENELSMQDSILKQKRRDTLKGELKTKRLNKEISSKLKEKNSNLKGSSK